MLQNPFKRSSRTSYISNAQLYSSVLHSKSITQLENKKPWYFINEGAHNRSKSTHVNSQKLQNPFQNRTFRINSYHKQPKHTKNPFIFTAPYRYTPIDPTNQKLYGLAAWERNKYQLKGYNSIQNQHDKYFIKGRSIFMDRNNLIDYNWVSQKVRESNHKVQMYKIYEQAQYHMDKAERIEQILHEKNNQHEKQTKTVSFNIRDSNNNKVTSSIDLATLRKQASNLQTDRKQVSESGTVINKLNNIYGTKISEQNELIRMTDSRTYEYKLGADLRGQYDDDREFNFDVGRFKEFHSDKQAVEEASKLDLQNHGGHPSSITYRNTVYHKIRFD